MLVCCVSAPVKTNLLGLLVAHKLCLAEVVALLITLLKGLHVQVLALNFKMMRLLRSVVVRFTDHRHRARWPVLPKHFLVRRLLLVARARLGLRKLASRLRVQLEIFFALVTNFQIVYPLELLI